jgi:hypothetical protein
MTVETSFLPSANSCLSARKMPPTIGIPSKKIPSIRKRYIHLCFLLCNALNINLLIWFENNINKNLFFQNLKGKENQIVTRKIFPKNEFSTVFYFVNIHILFSVPHAKKGCKVYQNPVLILYSVV